MLKVGDLVKVISKTKCDGDLEEFIPIGSICVVEDIITDKYGDVFYEIRPSDEEFTFYYLRNELEKGHLEWVKEET